MALTPEQDEYLKNHRLAVLATGRQDGSPQVSTIMYHYDGTDIVTSVKSYTAKWNNALRQPKVALLVNDGRKQLVLYGEAEGIADDPERKQLTRRMHVQWAASPATRTPSSPDSTKKSAPCCASGPRRPS